VNDASQSNDATKAARNENRILRHRDKEYVLTAWAGVRIVSYNVDAFGQGADAVDRSFASMKAELATVCPNAYEATILAAWFDPTAEVMRFRIRMPYDRYIAWKRASMDPVTATRSAQTIPDEIDLYVANRLTEKLARLSLTSHSEDAKALQRAASDAKTVAPADGDGGIGTVASTMSRLTVRKPQAELVIMIVPCVVAAVLALLLAGPAAMLGILTGCAVTILMLEFGSRMRTARKAGTQERQTQRPTGTPQFDWQPFKDAVGRSAQGRFQEVSLAQMRISTLLDSNVATTNQSVVDAHVRIESGLRELTRSFETATRIADSKEKAAMTEQLADSLVALGVEAEDARLMAFTDASFDFQTTARYIQSRVEPALRIDAPGA
jgi:hypothetical protein